MNGLELEASGSFNIHTHYPQRRRKQQRMMMEFFFNGNRLAACLVADDVRFLVSTQHEYLDLSFIRSKGYTAFTVTE